MKRKDMDGNVLYAIEADGYNTRPGLVLDPGTNPGKVKVRVFWSWRVTTGEDQNYLETDEAVIRAGKYDDKECGTGGIKRPWAEYVAERVAERQARIDKQNAEVAEEEARRAARIARAEAAIPHIEGMAYMSGDLAYAAKHGYSGERRYSFEDVCAVIEHLTGTS